MVQIYCQGKLNSAGCVPFLTTSGLPSTTGTQFRIVGNDMVPNEIGFLIYSGAKSNLNFHGGTLCVKSPFRRVLPAKSSGSAGTPPCSGSLLRNFNNVIQNGSDPTLTVGRTVRGQMYQRDPADPAARRSAGDDPGCARRTRGSLGRSRSRRPTHPRLSAPAMGQPAAPCDLGGAAPLDREDRRRRGGAPCRHRRSGRPDRRFGSDPIAPPTARCAGLPADLAADSPETGRATARPTATPAARRSSS